jgi:hypothetical protein
MAPSCPCECHEAVRDSVTKPARKETSSTFSLDVHLLFLSVPIANYVLKTYDFQETS